MIGISYKPLYRGRGAHVEISEDKISLVDSPHLRPIIEIRFYKYEEGYCIRACKRINNTLHSICSFKGSIKLEEKRILFIDFHQVPPIKPAIFITFNNQIEVFVRKDIENHYECPQKQQIHKLHTRYIRTHQKQRKNQTINSRNVNGW